MIKEKVDKLEILFEFIQSDFDKIDEISEQYDALMTANVLLRESRFRVKSPEREDAPSVYPEWESMVGLCGQVHSLCRLIYDCTQYNGIITYERTMSINCNREKFDKFNQRLMHSSGDKYDIVPFFPPSNPSNPRWDIISLESELIFIFDLLEDLPFDRIKQCTNCGKLFIQKTAREKKFCSNYCKVKKHLKDKKSATPK